MNLASAAADLGSSPRVLIVATQQIGDVLLTTPLLRAVRTRWPQATIDLLGHAGTLGMLSGNPDLSQALEVPARESWQATLARLRMLWRRYDLALVTRASDRAHGYGFAAARVRSGVVPSRLSNGWWKRALCRHVVVSDEVVHTVDEKLALIRPWLPADLQQRRFDVVPPAAEPVPAEWADAVGPAPVVVQVPSMWRYKQWPLAHYRVLVEALLGDGRQVVLSGGPSPHDRALVHELMTALGPPAVHVGAARQLTDLCGRLSLNQMAGLLRHAALYIGPDTAITHLAAACGTPLLALFGPTNPLRWGPRPAAQTSSCSLPAYVRRMPEQRIGPVWLLQGEAECVPGVPCGLAGCEDRTDSASQCLEQGLAPERVIAAARQRLQSAVRAVRT